MRSLFIIILVIALMSFPIILSTSNSNGSIISSKSVNQLNGDVSILSQQDLLDTYLSPPVIFFAPLYPPSLPSFPYINYTIGGNVSIWIWSVQVPQATISAPNILDLPSYIFNLTVYIFEWIGVSIINGILYVIQALYLIFAYIEYWILQAFVEISDALGIFALPVIVTLFIVIAIVIRVLLGIAKDASVVGLLAGG